MSDKIIKIIYHKNNREEKNVKKKKGFFSISAVAKMFSIHQQTIRLYEKEGLIAPKRSEGNTRLFCQEDVDKLEEIIYLTHQLGINLAGVQMILKLQKQVKKLQKDMNKILNAAQMELTKQADIAQQSMRQSSQKLYAIKQKKQSPAQEPPCLPNNQTLDIDKWDIDYDE